MKTYEVTLKFSKPPWYTGLAKAEDANQATRLIKIQAGLEGFKGDARATVKEISA